MKSFAFLLTLGSCLSFTSAIHPRRHHEKMESRNVGITNVTQDISLDKRAGVWPRDIYSSWSGIATSYVPNGGYMEGACGWGSDMDRQDGSGYLYGAALMTQYFGAGIQCGTCIQMTTKNRAGQMKSFKVVAVDSCPGTCHGIDTQIDGMLAWLGAPRVGQTDITARVVPCAFTKGVEVRQVSNNPWDLRLNIRRNSGAIQKLEVATNLKGPFFKMSKSTTVAWTPDVGGVSHQILSHPIMTLRMTNIKGEVVTIGDIAIRPASWVQTNQNFKTT